MPGIGRYARDLRDNFTITQGRSRIRFADNVNATCADWADWADWADGIPTNVWVDRNPRTGLPERQLRGGRVRVAGLTRIEDLACASLVRRNRLAA